jgi:hypothetical protein
MQPAQAAQRRWTVECFFSEPGANLMVSPVQVVWSAGTESSLTNATVVTTKSSMTISGTITESDSTVGEFRGVITKKPGNIGESDYTTPWTLASNFVNNPSVGCIRYSDGMELHRAINVAPNDPLFIRSSPSAKGKALETIFPGGVVMVDPTKRKGDWMRADIAYQHKSDGKSRPLPVVHGWVNSTFIDPQPFQPTALPAAGEHLLPI